MLRGLPYIAAAGKFSALRTWARAKNLAWLHGHRGARLLYAKTAQSPERPGGTREGNAHGHGRDVGRSRFKTRVLVGFDHKSPVLANHVSLAEKELPIARREQWPPAPRAALNGCLRLVSSAEQIDEALTVVWNWLGRKRAPKGFRPMYQVGRVQLLTTLQALANHADNLPGTPAGYIQGFLTSLAGAISPLATLSLFRDKEDLKESLIALDADLTQHLALMETAQRELEAKTEHLARAGEVIGQVEEWAAAAEASSLAIHRGQDHSF